MATLQVIGLGYVFSVRIAIIAESLCVFNCDVDNAIQSTLTVNRIDWGLSHEVGNCELACHQCNVSTVPFY